MRKGGRTVRGYTDPPLRVPRRQVQCRSGQGVPAARGVRVARCWCAAYVPERRVRASLERRLREDHVQVRRVRARVARALASQEVAREDDGGATSVEVELVEAAAHRPGGGDECAVPAGALGGVGGWGEGE